MKLIFFIDYHTVWGESVYLTGPLEQLGDWNEDTALKMELHGSQTWRAEIDVPDNITAFEYRYIVKNDTDRHTRHEYGSNHIFRPARISGEYRIYDSWQDQPADKPFYSSVFTDCICRRDKRDRPLNIRKGYLHIRVSAPMVMPGQVIAVTGEPESLGSWDPTRAVVMNDAHYPQWEANIELKDLPASFQYKFLIIDKTSGNIVAWEDRDNRMFDYKRTSGIEALVISGLRFVNPQPYWHGAGTAIPVFSIRTEEDYGVGDFYDIKLMVDWAVATKQTVLQLLPINDTTMTHTWTDSYPYNANSTFALHPMYLRITELGSLDDSGLQDKFNKLGHELNQLPTVDYERVNNAKNEYTRALFAQNGGKTIKSKEFKSFFAANAHWLKPYAAFCVLRDRYRTPNFNAWDEYAVYDQARIDTFIRHNRQDIEYVYYIQYHIDRQMHEVRQYANEHGVALKGDIPIGISRYSVDAWIEPRLFNLDCQAGAPPDDFSVLGQNWGFPTYNWDEMSKDGFAWWKSRMRKMAEYFDAFRIDHVLGFFRIWQIPMDAIHGLLGTFNPALPYSPDELRYSYDFWLDTDKHVTPYIMDWFLHDFFGEFTDEAKDRFLDPAGEGRYRMKPGFNTQRKVSNYFESQPKDDKNERLCNALLGLIDQVLFIEDPYEKGKYHPRISAQHTYIYRSLNDYEKWCFNRLYNNFYYHRHNDFWYGKAMWKLPPLLDATNMLVCAEDLGMIPACVPAVMNRLEILSLEIQRMPKDPSTPFGLTGSYPYYSVCTTSTHDMGGIRQWWEEDRANTQKFYNEILHEQGEAPVYAEPWICDKIITLHLQSPSMLAIFPLQDWLSMSGPIRRDNPHDEQINVPANSRHYWRYRMHLTVERLLTDTAFTAMIHDKILSSKR